jgi:hypothetical protein
MLGQRSRSTFRLFPSSASLPHSGTLQCSFPCFAPSTQFCRHKSDEASRLQPQHRAISPTATSIGPIKELECPQGCPHVYSVSMYTGPACTQAVLLRASS